MYKELFELIAKAVASNQGKKNTWFVFFMGHVNQLELKFYPNGWGPKREPLRFSGYLSQPGVIDDAVKFLKENL